jgi:hypothetical protein
MTTNPTDRAARIAEIAERHELSADEIKRERVLFEQWNRARDRGRPNLLRNQSGEYLTAERNVQFRVWLARAALSTADAERREMARLAREAAGVAHDNSMGGALGSWFCERCGAITKQKSWPHFDQFEHGPDCLVTKLRQAADRAEGN